ncbi:MAG: hypothetical protein ACRC20_00315 [Segniliparus sp.]|uniref:hypothetical protein n=1 Tax=Segniliparus sp. TaxID=2804064 RepID=UPI003F3CE4BA
MYPTLAEIAAQSGLSLVDVAFFANMDESTVSRLWVEDDWLDRVKGKTLQSLIAVLPGVAESMVGHVLKQRRSVLVEELQDVGLVVDFESFRKLVREERIPEQRLAAVLETALNVMRKDPQKSAAYLSRFWGRKQDEALGYLWKNGAAGGLFADPRPFAVAAAELAGTLPKNAGSFRAIMAHATLAHHTAKATGCAGLAEGSDKLNRRLAMAYRSASIGRIIQTEDVEEAQRYDRAVRENPLLRLVEGWAFPTFNRDVAVTADFSITGSLLLRKTAQGLLRDLATPNDAYFHYLAATAVPAMLRYDPTLGMRAPEVRAAVRDRAEHCASPVTRRAAGDLSRLLPECA